MIFGLFNKGAEIALETERKVYLPGEEIDVCLLAYAPCKRVNVTATHCKA